jgi:hypothetical protein
LDKQEYRRNDMEAYVFFLFLVIHRVYVNDDGLVVNT